MAICQHGRLPYIHIFLAYIHIYRTHIHIWPSPILQSTIEPRICHTYIHFQHTYISTAHTYIPHIHTHLPHIHLWQSPILQSTIEPRTCRIAYIYANLQYPLVEEKSLQIFGSPDYPVFLDSLLGDRDSDYSWENLFEILGTPEKTCLICTGTLVKTGWKFGQS